MGKIYFIFDVRYPLPSSRCSPSSQWNKIAACSGLYRKADSSVRIKLGNHKAENTLEHVQVHTASHSTKLAPCICSCVVQTRSDCCRFIKVSIILCVLSVDSFFAISVASVAIFMFTLNKFFYGAYICGTFQKINISFFIKFELISSLKVK